MAEGDAEVIACDIDEDKVRQIADVVHHSLILDATDEKTLKESGMANADSILVVVQLMELGVKRVIHPERDMAVRLAHSLLVGGFIEEIPIADDYSIFKRLHYKTLKALDLRKSTTLPCWP
ncbi:MAG: NAD-binding protein [Aquificaceae bacterium]|nr:NAD-binding protein [Aquificaceae bacterium]MDW8097662.1 NAD-binding protein [Aquificaceae bacterium]